jgi:DNA-binding IclR family transcriptional regulator
LSKAVVVLDALAELGVAGPSELSRRTGLAKTTAYRTASELYSVGLIERAGDGFRLGPKLFELGNKVPGRRHLRDAALPYLEDLSRATNQTVHLAVLDNAEVIFIERLVGRRSDEVPSSVSTRLPLHCTATGKCILAYGPDDIATTVLEAPLQPMTDRSIADPDQLRAQLADIKVSGIAQEIGEVVDGLRSLAAPIHGHRQELVGALSATGPSDDFDIDRIEPMVRLAASGLSRRLGGT